MRIRKEKQSDIEAIFEVIKQAFKNHPINLQSGQFTEQYIVNALRDDNTLAISLVAEIDEKIIGHIAFSPVKISDGSCDWYALGPVSVLNEYQRQGIGQTLINEGLSQLKFLGAQGCILVGEPEYYNRFGFKSFPELTIQDLPQEYVLILPFVDKIPTGSVIYHHAFSI